MAQATSANESGDRPAHWLLCRHWPTMTTAPRPASGRRHLVEVVPGITGRDVAAGFQHDERPRTARRRGVDLEVQLTRLPREPTSDGRREWDGMPEPTSKRRQLPNSSHPPAVLTASGDGGVDHARCAEGEAGSRVDTSIDGLAATSDLSAVRGDVTSGAGADGPAAPAQPTMTTMIADSVANERIIGRTRSSR